MTFPFDTLRRWPDVEAPELLAADAADRLLLDESAGARAALDDGALVVIGDTHGALTLASAAEGARRIRVHQDPLTGERALAANAERLAVDDDAFSSLPFDADLVRDAEVVLLRLPRSLDELDDVAALIARHASRGVTVFAGGRIKHMTVAMNDVLRRHFDVVDVTHARQKSRVLVARGPKDGHDPEPRSATHDGLVVCAYGGVFAGTSVDIGTRFLLDNLSGRVAGGGTADDPVVDMACGTGVVAATFARQGLHAYASDQSAAAVASARATAAANGVSDLVRVERDDLLSLLDDASVSFIALNPPFHVGAAVYEGVAARLFADAARVLRPGGELWTVWNSALLYRPALERVVGPTRQIARNSKFTVMASVRSASAYDR
ncbi:MULTISPECIES: class I SAM-dependent methyltransferase [unclassified Microbacterium]|uniref:class I SAM-dependent methyltransferase n=1 Tax=unclassified Microbacterium TaxID=2609290 RepID=UPI000D56DD9B|nr:methyltransferase [Microbacterium sp. Gd 4-13]PVW04754.1 SAM-dependent methyltransferase [Microbacterium sp. Gd 4-13]